MLMPPTSNGGARRTYQGARYTALRTYQSARETPQAKAIATWARRSCTHTLPSALCFFHPLAPFAAPGSDTLWTCILYCRTDGLLARPEVAWDMPCQQQPIRQ